MRRSLEYHYNVCSLKTMKISLLVLALVSFLRVYATTFSILETTNQPPLMSAAQGAIVPMLTVLVTESDKKFPPPLYLAVQPMGNSLWNGNPMTGIYVGSDLKEISRGPFGFLPHAPILVGPIFLTQGETNTVVISAQFASDLTLFQGQNVGLEVVGAAADGYFTELSDRVTFATPFPIRGNFYTIDTNVVVGKLDIQNTTAPTSVQGSTNPVVLAKFTVTVEGTDVTIPYFSVAFNLSGGERAITQSITLTDENGTQIGGSFDAIPFDNKVSSGVVFNGDIKIPKGIHQFIVTGILGTNFPTGVTLSAECSSFGTATDALGYQLLPTINNANQGIVVRSLARFLFATNLTVGSVGYDVLILQRFLGVPLETYELDGSPYFGELTQAGVKAFQAANGIPATGFVGPITRATLNGMNLDPYVWPATVSISLAPAGFTYVNILMSGQPDTAYRLEGSPDLKSWSLIETLSMAEDGLRGYKFDTESDLKFYRMVRP